MEIEISLLSKLLSAILNVASVFETDQFDSDLVDVAFVFSKAGRSRKLFATMLAMEWLFLGVRSGVDLEIVFSSKLLLARFEWTDERFFSRMQLFVALQIGQGGEGASTVGIIAWIMLLHE